MKTEVQLAVCQIFAEVIGRPLDIPDFEIKTLTHSLRVRAVPSGILVTFAYSQ